MKKIFAFCVVTLSFLALHAQPGTWYVAAKAGLSIREKPSASAKVLTKIPYGEKITVTSDTSNSLEVTTEGFKGNWMRTTYKGQSGYVLNSYLLPQPVPKSAIKTLKEYLAQVSATAGPQLQVKKGDEETFSNLTKQLYKNGSELHEFSGYEYSSETCFIPDFTLQQGYLLIRLMKLFPDAIAENDPLPSSNSTKKLKNGERRITLEKKDYGGSEPVLEGINIEWEDGATYQLHLFMIDNQLVIFSSGGV